ncbi:MAG: hypothetical protein ACR2HG_05020 [Pyrinomonadaceae bacterium]
MNDRPSRGETMPRFVESSSAPKTVKPERSGRLFARSYFNRGRRLNGALGALLLHRK